MRTASIGRMTLAAVAGALIAAATAGGAQASTIHACVKPKSGATRIVGAKAKCRHGEQRLSWSTTGAQGKTGPAGAPGAPGAPGAAGASGIGPAFTGGAATTHITESPGVVFTKTVPPGDYFVSTPVVLSAEASAAKKLVSVDCYVVDNPGTSFTSSEFSSKALKVVALAGWQGPLDEESPTEFHALNTITPSGAVESKVTSTLAMLCFDLDTSPGVTVESPLAELTAIQVSSITS